VPADGATIGEIMMRGNVVMKGYLKNPSPRAQAFAGGWFHTGDLAVKHPDGYVEIKDRSKDIIISGGENISSIEVEDALYRHPDVIAAAPWSRGPTRNGARRPAPSSSCAEGGPRPTAEEIIAFCRERLAHFKAPRTVVFGAAAEDLDRQDPEVGVRLGLGHMPGDLVLDPEFFAFKFNDAEIIGMRPVDFLVDCAFDGRVLGAQRRNTLIRCHSDLQ
jgi:hypothetical protein